MTKFETIHAVGAVQYMLCWCQISTLPPSILWLPLVDNIKITVIIVIHSRVITIPPNLGFTVSDAQMIIIS